MIRGAVIHMLNEQPLLADLQSLPTANDACLTCTNLRMMNGKRPSFADHIDSWFLIPMTQVRFIEIPQSVLQSTEFGTGDAPMGADGRRHGDGGIADLEPDEDFLRRIREA